MDLQNVAKSSGRSGQLAKIGVVICFALACALLAGTHARASLAKPDRTGALQLANFATR